MFKLNGFMIKGSIFEVYKHLIKPGKHWFIGDTPKDIPKDISESFLSVGPRQANLVLIAYASSKGSGEPAHPRSLARTSAVRSYKQ